VVKMPEKEKVAKKAPDYEIWISGVVANQDLRYTQGGLGILRLTLAGEAPKAFYLEVEALGDKAERWGDRLLPGTPVLVRGVVSQRKGQDGKEYTRIRAREFRVLGGEVSLSEPDAKGNRRMQGATNLFVGTGVLATDPVLRTAPSGDQVAAARVVLREGGENDAFLRLEAWGEVAKVLGVLSKGTPVFVQGRLKGDSWTDKEGKKRYELVIVAEGLSPIGKGKAQAEEPPVDLEEGLEDALPEEEDLPF